MVLVTAVIPQELVPTETPGAPPPIAAKPDWVLEMAAPLPRELLVSGMDIRDCRLSETDALGSAVLGNDPPDMRDCKLPVTDPSDVWPDASRELMFAFTSALIAEWPVPLLPPLELPP